MLLDILRRWICTLAHLRYDPGLTPSFQRENRKEKQFLLWQLIRIDLRSSTACGFAELLLDQALWKPLRKKHSVCVKLPFWLEKVLTRVCKCKNRMHRGMYERSSTTFGDPREANWPEICPCKSNTPTDQHMLRYGMGWDAGGLLSPLGLISSLRKNFVGQPASQPRENGMLLPTSLTNSQPASNNMETHASLS